MRNIITVSKYLFLVFIIKLIFNNNSIYAVDTNAVAYFPLTVGNIYIYNVKITPPYPPRDTVYRGKIVTDTSILGRKYFRLSGFPFFGLGWYRVDTATGSLRKFNSSNTCPYYISESFVDSLAAEQGNIIKYCGVSDPSASWICNLKDTLTLFSLSTFKKAFQYDWRFGSYHDVREIRYAKNIGMYIFYYISSGMYTYYTTSCVLKGCVVNGILYGDTSVLVGINKISNDIPAFYTLSQNYPNPFNPRTVIPYSLKEAGFVNLTIYDVAGKEVQKLVNWSILE
jgi:hypothetical protein